MPKFIEYKDPESGIECKIKPISFAQAEDNWDLIQSAITSAVIADQSFSAGKRVDGSIATNEEVSAARVSSPFIIMSKGLRDIANECCEPKLRQLDPPHEIGVEILAKWFELSFGGFKSKKWVEAGKLMISTAKA